MYLTTIKLEEQQKEKLFEIKNKIGLPVSVQIRKAIDQYLEKIGDEK